MWRSRRRESAERRRRGSSRPTSPARSAIRSRARAIGPRRSRPRSRAPTSRASTALRDEVAGNERAVDEVAHQLERVRAALRDEHVDAAIAGEVARHEADRIGARVQRAELGRGEGTVAEVPQQAQRGGRAHAGDDFEVAVAVEIGDHDRARSRARVVWRRRGERCLRSGPSARGDDRGGEAQGSAAGDSLSCRHSTPAASVRCAHGETRAVVTHARWSAPRHRSDGRSNRTGRVRSRSATRSARRLRVAYVRGRARAGAAYVRRSAQPRGARGEGYRAVVACASGTARVTGRSARDTEEPRERRSRGRAR